MQFEKTRDIIDHIRKVHGSISQRYSIIRDKADSGRVKMLLDFMSRHEARLEKSLANFSEDRSDKLMESWFQYTPDDAVYNDLKSFELKPDMRIDDVISMALKVDKALIHFFHELADHAGSQELRDLFCSLVEFEQQEAVLMEKNALDIKEI